MANKETNPFVKLKGMHIVYPILIGLGIVFILLYRDFNPEAFQSLKFRNGMWYFVLLAIFFMLMRDFWYIVRIRILTHNKLTWQQAFRVIMLWEFTSAVTPSAVGGTTIATLYVHKEGVSLGRSTAVVLATSFLDELYFILIFPLILIFIQWQDLFSVGIHHGKEFSYINEFLIFAITGFSLKFVYLIFLSYGLFVNPRGLKWLLLWIFKIPFLRKFRYAAHITGTDIIKSSRELRSQGVVFWLKAFSTTFLSWTSRYWVVNALLLAFFVVKDHFLLFARQLVMWLMMLVSPTPGGSGFSELIFKEYLGDLIPVNPAIVGTIAISIALIWRMLSYYPYLLVGAIILPKWLKSKFKK